MLEVREAFPRKVVDDFKQQLLKDKADFEIATNEFQTFRVEKLSEFAEKLPSLLSEEERDTIEIGQILLRYMPLLKNMRLFL